MITELIVSFAVVLFSVSEELISGNGSLLTSGTLPAISNLQYSPFASIQTLQSSPEYPSKQTHTFFSQLPAEEHQFLHYL